MDQSKFEESPSPSKLLFCLRSRDEFLIISNHGNYIVRRTPRISIDNRTSTVTNAEIPTSKISVFRPRNKRVYIFYITHDHWPTHTTTTVQLITETRTDCARKIVMFNRPHVVHTLFTNNDCTNKVTFPPDVSIYYGIGKYIRVYRLFVRNKNECPNTVHAHRYGEYFMHVQDDLYDRVNLTERRITRVCCVHVRTAVRLLENKQPFWY